MNISRIVRLNIDVIYSADDTVMSSQIGDVMTEDNRVNPMEYQQYNEFVTNVWMLLKTAGFDDLVEYQDSPYSITSKYFTMIRPEDVSDSNIKCVTNIRVSDHDLEDESLLNKSISYVIYRNIVVNGQHFETYDQALVYIRNRINSWL